MAKADGRNDVSNDARSTDLSTGTRSMRNIDFGVIDADTSKEKYNKKHIEVATLTTSIINVITFLPMPRRQPCRASPNHSPLPRPLAETSPCHTTHTHSCRPTALAIQSTPRHASLAVSFRATHHRNARLQTRQLFLAYHTQRLVPPPRFPVFAPLSL